MATNARSNNSTRGRYVAGGTVESFPTRLGWWERKIISKSASDVKIVVTPRYHQRPDLLAFDMYGTATLMWLVLQFNSIIDINTEFLVGTEISLPTKSRVFSQILSTR